jgi:Protein of unknown function (DUF3352)
MRNAVRAIRAQLTLNRLLIAIVLVAAFLGVLALLEGNGSAHTDHAIALVPPNALLYAHLEVHRGSSQWRNARRALTRLTSLARLRDQTLGGLAAGRTPRQLDAELKPWLGGEAALALLPSGRQATSLVLLEVGNLQRAKSFLAGAGRSRIELYRNIRVRIYKTLSAAFIGDFMAIGRLFNVHAAIEAHFGRGLSDDAVFRQARDRLNLDGPLLYAYSPGDGVRRLLARQKGLVGRIGGLLTRPALRGAAAAVRFERSGLRASVATVDYPKLAGAIDNDPAFEPQLPRSVPDDAIAYYGVEGVTRLSRRLDAISGGSTSALTRGIEQVRRSLGRGGRRALARALAPLDRREAALVVTPPDDSPTVSLVVNDTTQRDGGDVLLALQPLLSRVVQSTRGGQASTLVPGNVGSIDTLTLRLNPDLALTYASLGDRIVVSTDPEGVRQISTAEHTLAGSGAFAPGMRDLLKQATSVIFLDLHRLSSLVERAGLGTTPEYQAIKPDLARIGTVSVITQSQRSSQTAQVFVEVP